MVLGAYAQGWLEAGNSSSISEPNIPEEGMRCSQKNKARIAMPPRFLGIEWFLRGISDGVVTYRHFGGQRQQYGRSAEFYIS